MDFNREEILSKYIRKSELADDQKPKMERNLQPEIEKLKSVANSIRGRYVTNNEKQRLIDEIDFLKKTAERL